MMRKARPGSDIPEALKTFGRRIEFLWGHPEVRGRRLRTLARIAAWQLWERTVRTPWTVRLAAGVRLKCYPHSWAATLVLYCRYPEWREMRLILDGLRSGDWFVDVGSNVGVYSLLACATPGVHVVAFEPSSAAADRAEENIALNGLGDRVRIERKAVSSHSGRGRLTSGRDAMNRLDPGSGSHAVEPVEIVALDEALPDHVVASLAVVKVDVEGDELSVLRGAERVIATAKPLLIVERNQPAQIASFLMAHGYRACDYDPLTGELWPSDDGEGQMNDIFVPDLGAWQIRLAKGKSVQHPVTRLDK